MERTNGTWKVYEDHMVGIQDIVAEDGMGFFTVPIAHIVTNNCEHDANANLIAAAPDMYEALKDLLSAYEYSTKGKRSFNMLDAESKAIYRMCEDACIKTEHALAKAEGKGQ